MKIALQKLKPGRVLLLRVIMYALIAGSLLYLGVNVHKLADDFRNAGSLQELWLKEWRSGEAIGELVASGLFQLFLLIMGWSFFFRLRTREMAHLRLRRSEQNYRTIINHAGEAIFLLDGDGFVLEWNKAAEQLFKLARRTVLNRRFEDLDLELNIDLGQAFADTGRIKRSLHYEALLERKNDAPVVLSLTFSSISPMADFMAEKSGSFVVIARDITSEKQLESRMGEAEKLAGIGQLAAGIAHQLNTPLGSILLSAQMLEDTTRNEDDAEDIHRIIRQTEQCRGIIKGLLNFARPTGRGRGRNNLGDIVREASFLLEKNLKVAKVDVNITESVEPWVFGNRNELEQVFFNLLANSQDAMPRGGRIDIDLRAGDPGEILVVFTDTGEGIPADSRDKIFLPFFTTKDYGKGTGLGLSIVARIVHEHGGRIELESEAGQGTTFRLSFPVARSGQGSSSLIEDDA